MSEKIDRVVKLRRKFDATTGKAAGKAAAEWIDAENGLTPVEFTEYQANYRCLVGLDKAREQLADAKEMNTAAWQRFEAARREEFHSEQAYRESRKRVREARARLFDLEQKRARLF